MTRTRPGLTHALAVALTGAATTWLTLLAWRGFTERPGDFLTPLAVLAVLVALTGALTRWARWHGLAVVATQVAVLGLFLSAHLGGSAVPDLATFAAVRDSVAVAVETAQSYSSPVPADVPGVHPLLVIGGGACLLLVDLAVGTLRRPALAGLPLLTIYTLPVSLLTDVTWWVFALGAGGFCLMLLLKERDQVAHWGRPLHDPAAPGTRLRGARSGALVVASSAVALGVAAPHVVPTFNLELVEWGRGAGGGSSVTLENPMADLRRDLRRGQDVPLVRVRTDEPNPAYLRIAVLSRFSGNTWSSGDRQIPDSQEPRGVMPPLKGVRPRLPREQFGYGITVTEEFRSTWLPTPAPISRINAAGAWRYDLDTMDFLASREGLTTDGMQYSATAVRLELDGVAMDRSPRGRGAVPPTFTELPDNLPDFVEELTDEVVEGASSDFARAVALQEWFREDGGFEYSLDVDPGNGTDELVAFLREGRGGRVGYCEQFASAMAVMARILGIPARVAVGFLRPDRISGNLWEYSAHDLHAWPEIYISGAGWVRFEPTPAARANDVPGYTTQDITRPDRPNDPTSPTEAAPPADGPDAADRPNDEDPGTSASGDAETGLLWVRIGAGLLVVLVALLLLVPSARRRARRRARWAEGSPESAWLELRDTAVDLGLPWPTGRSPRSTALAVADWFAAPAGPAGPVRPERGPRTNPAAVAALMRLVEALERARYARRPDPAAAADLRRDTEECVDGLRSGFYRKARRRADWWPASAFGRSGVPSDATDSEEDAALDHMGR